MRQAGVLAAAALHALDHHVERLATDHANARRLAAGLAEIDGVQIDPDRVETNIVICEVADAYELCGRLWERGVQLAPLGPQRLRAVTHLDVDDAGIERALEEFRQVLEGPGG
jgi:threonine aldolase